MTEHCTDCGTELTTMISRSDKLCNPCQDARRDAAKQSEIELGRMGRAKLIAKIEALEAEIETDDQLLANRKDFIDKLSDLVGECEPHGDQCIPNIVDRVAALIRQRNDEETAALHSGGILSDVCDVVFDDPDRAAKHGYDGVVERCRELVAKLAAADLIIPAIDRLADERDQARRIAVKQASIVGPRHGYRETMPWEDGETSGAGGDDPVRNSSEQKGNVASPPAPPTCPSCGDPLPCYPCDEPPGHFDEEKP